MPRMIQKIIRILMSYVFSKPSVYFLPYIYSGLRKGFGLLNQSIFPRLQLIFPIKKPEKTCQKLVKMKDTSATSVKRLYDEGRMRWHNNITLQKSW